MAMFFLTPAIGWSLPLVWPLAMAAAGAMGYGYLTDSRNDLVLRGRTTREMEKLRSVKVPLERLVTDMVADEVKREEVLRFAKDDIVLVFKRDSRGKFEVEAMGPAERSHRELETAGLEFAEALVQQFAYNRMVTELEKKGATVVEETVSEEGDVILTMRRWT